MNTRIVTAFFSGRAQAEGALGRLLELGVPPDAISVLPKHVGHVADLGIYVASKASEGIAAGAITGGLVGGLLGTIAAAGSLVIPDLDSVVAGPLVAALAGAGAAGALGVLIGGLWGARIPEFEARLLPDAVGMGGALLSVRCSAAAAPGIERSLEASGARLLRRAWAYR